MICVAHSTYSFVMAFAVIGGAMVGVGLGFLVMGVLRCVHR
jgi:hypothetical protein